MTASRMAINRTQHLTSKAGYPRISQRMGCFAFAASEFKNELDFEEAKDLYQRCKGKFEYVNGKAMKVNLTGDSFDPLLYDRDNGENTAQTVIDSLRSGLSLGSVDTLPEELSVPGHYVGKRYHLI